MASAQLLAELCEHAQEIRMKARVSRAYNVRVFGSAARGEESASSDVHATTADLLRDEVRARAPVVDVNRRTKSH